ASLGGPLFSAMLQARAGDRAETAPKSPGHDENPVVAGPEWGLDPARFGKHPPVDSASTASGVRSPDRARPSTPPDPPLARGGNLREARPVPFPPLLRGGQGGFF